MKYYVGLYRVFPDFDLLSPMMPQNSNELSK
jgi:hypothetical protein